MLSLRRCNITAICRSIYRCFWFVLRFIFGLHLFRDNLRSLFAFLIWQRDLHACNLFWNHFSRNTSLLSFNIFLIMNIDFICHLLFVIWLSWMSSCCLWLSSIETFIKNHRSFHFCLEPLQFLKLFICWFSSFLLWLPLNWVCSIFRRFTRISRSLG